MRGVDVKVNSDLELSKDEQLAITRAKRELELLMRSAVRQNLSGIVGIRVPRQRGRFGNIRSIVESEQ